ncbi:MAG TPA: type IV pili methyl-accepting chemotaxis transducer N-terminal domain-containing protein, partial [Luteimonas sp.]|nr:type IV pili methyl-accepting chemotaxis transducer N-terminal domain-containing protein [Luteimonas sp.]
MIILVLSLLVFLANFFTASYLSRQENNARSLTAELQVLSQQLAKYSKEAVEGNADSFQEFKDTKTRIDAIVNALNKGSVKEGVPPYSSGVNSIGVSGALKKVTDVWTKMSQDADRISKGQEQVLSLTDTANSFNSRIPQVSARLDEVVRAMSDSNAPASQIGLANRQIVLAYSMSRHVTEVLAGGEKAVSAADALSRDSAVFGQVLTGLKQGNPDMGVVKVTSPAALTAVEQVEKLYTDSQKEMESILQASTDLFEVQQSATTISGDSNVLLEDSQALFSTFGSVNLRRPFPNNYIAIIAGVMALLSILGLLWTINRDQRKRLASTTELNTRNQEAILRLLDEMGALAEGDLTVKATVTEDITGAIADSINFT